MNLLRLVQGYICFVQIVRYKFDFPTKILMEVETGIASPAPLHHLQQLFLWIMLAI